MGFGNGIENNNSVSEAKESQYTSNRYELMMKRVRKNTNRLVEDESLKSINGPSMSYDTKDRQLDDILEADHLNEE